MKRFITILTITLSIALPIVSTTFAAPPVQNVTPTPENASLADPVDAAATNAAAKTKDAVKSATAKSKKVCKKGKPCGNTCISAKAVCHSE